MPLTENLAEFLRDFGVACSKGGVAFKGILDQPGEDMHFGGADILTTRFVLTMLRSDQLDLAVATGDALVVAGQTYMAREVLAVDDGAFVHVTMSQ